MCNRYVADSCTDPRVFCVGQCNGVLEVLLRPTVDSIGTKHCHSTLNTETIVWSVAEGLDGHHNLSCYVW